MNWNPSHVILRFFLDFKVKVTGLKIKWIEILTNSDFVNRFKRHINWKLIGINRNLYLSWSSWIWSLQNWLQNCLGEGGRGGRPLISIQHYTINPVCIQKLAQLLPSCSILRVIAACRCGGWVGIWLIYLSACAGMRDITYMRSQHIFIRNNCTYLSAILYFLVPIPETIENNNSSATSTAAWTWWAPKPVQIS